MDSSSEPRSRHVRPCPGRSRAFDELEQLGDLQAEGLGQALDVQQADVARAPRDVREVGAVDAGAANSSRVRPGASRRSVAAKPNCARIPGRAPSTWGPCRARCRLWAYRRWVMFAAAIGSRGCSPTGAPCYPDRFRVRLTGAGQPNEGGFIRKAVGAVHGCLSVSRPSG